MTTEETNLLALIDIAFRDVTLKDGISLNMTEFLDDYGMTASFAERAKFDERTDWRSISDATLEAFQVTFSFTDLLGYRFYAPAYMSWVVRNYKTSDNIIKDSTIYALRPTSYQFKETRFTEWFTEKQLAAILAFLDFCADRDGWLDGSAAADNALAIRGELGHTGG